MSEARTLSAVVRIPDTTSLMATYRVVTDDAGDVSGYERFRRCSRSHADAPDRSAQQQISPWSAHGREPRTGGAMRSEELAQ